MCVRRKVSKEILHWSKHVTESKTQQVSLVSQALQVHNTGLDQGVDASSGTDSEDTSQQEQKTASTSSASDASPGQESEEDSKSSEEDTTTATTPNSNSSESDESEETNAADQPAQIKSKNPEVIIA